MIHVKYHKKKYIQVFVIYKTKLQLLCILKRKRKSMILPGGLDPRDRFGSTGYSGLGAKMGSPEVGRDARCLGYQRCYIDYLGQNRHCLADAGCHLPLLYLVTKIQQHIQS